MVMTEDDLLAALDVSGACAGIVPRHAACRTMTFALPALMAIKQAMQYLLGGALIAAGANHFRIPDFYTSIMPAYLPWHLALVYLSGLAESCWGRCCCSSARSDSPGGARYCSSSRSSLQTSRWRCTPSSIPNSAPLHYDASELSSMRLVISCTHRILLNVTSFPAHSRR